MRTQILKFLLLVAAADVASGCGASAMSDEDVAPADDITTQQDNLWFDTTVSAWPNGVVNVCWDPLSVVRPNFAIEQGQVRRRLETTWATIAKVTFVGWTVCPLATTNQVQIYLDDTWDGISQKRGASGSYTVQLGVGRPTFAEGSLTPHEFGHVLGFTHEMSRPDFVESEPSCKGPNEPGTDLKTAPDRDSIMASTTYCHDRPNPSLWDAVGSANLYGKRVLGISPLVSAFNTARGDHGTMMSTTGINGMAASSYKFTTAEGWVFDMQVTGTVPLKLYWNQARGDFYSTATTAGQNAAASAGYTFVRNEGYVYSSSQTGTVALKLYWHAGRQDFLTIASNNPVPSGYTFVRDEGYIFTREAPPFKTIASFWNSSRGDNLSTTFDHPNSEEADGAGYSYNGVDGAILKNQLPGTVALQVFWRDDRKDWFTLAAEATESEAFAEGYSYFGIIGYVFTSNFTGLAPIRSYYSSARTDYFTTAHRSTSGYALRRTEGYTLRTQ